MPDAISGGRANDKRAYVVLRPSRTGKLGDLVSQPAHQAGHHQQDGWVIPSVSVSTLSDLASEACDESTG